jgi:hypothetical protein
MINSLQLWPYYRDTWGFWDAEVMSAYAPLDHNSCYQPKFYNAPDIGLQTMNPGAYQRYNLTITPGSLICAFFQNVNDLAEFAGEGNQNAPSFAVQIKDVSTGHKFSDVPLSNYFLSNPNSTFPNLLPCPYPVSGSGMFSVEFWANPANVGAQRIFLIFGVAEVIQCQ